MVHPVPSKRYTIAIDGPAGSGKTSISEELAKLLGYRLVATGNMFRSVALLAQGNEDEGTIAAVAQSAFFDFIFDGSFRTIVNGSDVTAAISSPDIIPLTSKIAQFESVRTALLQQQRMLASAGGVILEGRDIGNVVLPDADFKIFLDADFEIRVTRLFELLTPDERAKHRSLADFAQLLREVDDRDRARLSIPSGAIYHKTGNFSSREEAMILYHYIAQLDELLANAKALHARRI